MEKTYDPKKIEAPIYEFWEKSGYFEPPEKITHYQNNYCIILPPPNITGELHLGHAFQQTIMDILIRYHRMLGKNVLWITGFDHAGIATQILIENFIYTKTGKTRNQYTKEFLLQQIWKWKNQTEKSIIYQMKRLGNSISWANKHFTMDTQTSVAVREAFIKLYEDHLIYRGKRIVNWDSHLQTAISDLEVSHKQIQGFMWYIRYPLEHIILNNNHNNQNNNRHYIVVATTRPETILGDVAIAVNPKDNRYQQLIGKYVIVPIINRRIPIISDQNVDINTGTGCVKITPAHDFNDYVIAQKHKLSMIKIFSTNKKILQKPEIFNYIGQRILISNVDHYIPKILHNLHYSQARQIIVSECSKLDLLDNIKNHNLTIPYNNRTGAVIEPMLTDQWFIRTKTLAKEAINVVKNDIIQFIPEQYKNTYFEWMYNIQDWCISRQIHWGHEIPAWYDNNHNVYVGLSEENIRINNQLNNNVILHKDNNVLDTWFSSSLWALSSLGWPNNDANLSNFLPTNIIISGFDIIFFWIARMIMMTIYLTKDKNNNIQVPFKKVYITGLVRDKFGQKMSKSKGNVINPLDMIDGISIEHLLNRQLQHDTTTPLQETKENITKYIQQEYPHGINSYGADSLRLTLTALSSSGRDIHWDINRLKGYHSFCNKLWNVSKFVLLHTHNQDCGIQCHSQKKIFSLADRWIMAKLQTTIYNFTQSLNTYRFDKIISIMYEFVWHQFCDWYIEFTKPILYNDNNTLKLRGTRYALITSLETILRLLHPIIPFITEKIWQEIKCVMHIPNKTIMFQSFPQCDEAIINDIDSVNNFEWIQNVISEIRIFRAYTGILKNVPLRIAFNKISHNLKQCILENYHILIKIAQLENIDLFNQHNNTCVKSILVPLNESELFIFIPKTFNKKLAINRFLKEIESINCKIRSIQQTLYNHSHETQKNTFIKNQEKLKYYNLIKNKLINQFSIIKTL